MPEPDLHLTSAGGGTRLKWQKDGLAKPVSMASSSADGKNGSEAPSIVNDVLVSAGQPLDSGTRDFMESRLGHDFSAVRVHSNDFAARAAEAVNARAFTVGRDVVFGTGEYSPGTTEGRRLLAHELVHVVQQHERAQSIAQRVVYNEDAAWAAEVANATTDEQKLALLNKAAVDPEASLLPKLKLPILMLPANPAECVEYQIYYDPRQSDPGRVEKKRDQQYSDNPAVPGETTAPAYIVLGPDALSEHNKAHTQNVLHHESIHIWQREGLIDRSLLDPIANDSRAVYSAAKEMLAHASGFALYFSRLHFDDTRAWESGPGDAAVPHDALYDLQAISGSYWPVLGDAPQHPDEGAVKDEVIDRVTSVATTDAEKQKLCGLVGQLTGVPKKEGIGSVPGDFEARVKAKLGCP